MARASFLTAAALAIAVVGGSDARGANWPVLLGSEEGRRPTALQPFGFVQLRLESTPFAEDVNGQMASFNVDEPFGFALGQHPRHKQRD